MDAITTNKIKKCLTYNDEPIDSQTARVIMNMMYPAKVNNGSVVEPDMFERFIDHLNEFMIEEGIPEFKIVDE